MFNCFFLNYEKRLYKAFVEGHEDNGHPYDMR